MKNKIWGTGLLKFGCIPLVFALMLFCSPSFAQPKQVGIDAIGCVGFSSGTIQNIIATTPQGSALGCLLDKTFGAKTTNYETLLKSGKFTTSTPDLLNATAVRNKVLQPGELLKGYTIDSLNKAACSLDPKLTKIIDGQVALLNGYINKYPNISFNPSLFLEHDLSRQCAETIIGYARAKAKAGLQWIDSPVTPAGKGFPYARIGGTWIEGHGNTPVNAESISNDGSSIWDANLTGVTVSGTVDYRSRGTQIIEGWFHELNKNFTGGKVFIPPLQRKPEPSIDQLKTMWKLLRNDQSQAPPKPAQCKTSRGLVSPELWKVSAEDYKNGDARGSKPMFITTSRSKSIPVLSPSGKQIGSLGLYGAYAGNKGYNRYYLGAPYGSGDSGLTLSQKAGGDWVFLKDGNLCYAINSIRRSGYFRAGT